MNEIIEATPGSDCCILSENTTINNTICMNIDMILNFNAPAVRDQLHAMAKIFILKPF